MEEEKAGFPRGARLELRGWRVVGGEPQTWAWQAPFLGRYEKTIAGARQHGAGGVADRDEPGAIVRCGCPRVSVNATRGRVSRAGIPRFAAVGVTG